MLDYRLYFILDPQYTLGREPLEVLREALEGGITLLQIRYKGNDIRYFFELVKEAMYLAKAYGVETVVDDRVDIALALGTHVHLGRKDFPIKVARRLLGDGKIIGGTVNELEELEENIREGVDYVGAGPVFGTDKKGIIPPKGLSFLKSVKEKSKVPVVAVGGINIENVEEVLKTGVDGIAVISAISMQENVKIATRNLRDIIEKYLKPK